MNTFLRESAVPPAEEDQWLVIAHRGAPNTTDDDVVIASVVYGLDDAREMAESSGQHRQPVVVGMHASLRKVILPRARKMMRHAGLVSAEKVHNELSAREDGLSGAAPSDEAHEQQWWIE